MLPISTVPDVGLLFIAVADLVKPKEQTTVMWKQSSWAFGDVSTATRIEDVVIHLIGLTDSLWRRAINRLTHGTQNVAAPNAHRCLVFLRIERKAVFYFFVVHRLADDRQLLVRRQVRNDKAQLGLRAVFRRHTCWRDLSHSDEAITAQRDGRRHIGAKIDRHANRRVSQRCVTGLDVDFEFDRR